MTQNDKKLLLKDLCGRLPYGVKVCNITDDMISSLILIGIHRDTMVLQRDDKYEIAEVDEVKPYLFPMSSMTEEQQKEYRKICDLDMTILENRPMRGEPFPAMFNSQDWLDAHHFDYRGLIPMGLANDATGKNIY